MIFSTFAYFKIKTKSECGFEKWFCLMKQTERKLNVCFQYSMNREEKVSLGFVHHTDEESREFLVLLEGCPHKMKDFCLHFQKMSAKKACSFHYAAQEACLVEVICLSYLLPVENSASRANLNFTFFQRSLRYG